MTAKTPEKSAPSEGTVRKIMEQIHLIHKSKRKPNGITKADREARKSDDLLKRDFTADAPLQKCVTDITEIPAKDGKLYVSAIFDCYDLLPVGLAMADHMRAELCCETLKPCESAVSGNPQSHCAFRPWQPVYQCCISGSHSKIWHCAEYEQCRGKMS